MNHELDYPFNGVGFPLNEMLKQNTAETTEDILTTASGMEVFYRISPVEINVSDASGMDYWMYAEINPSGLVSFDLHTRKNGEHANRPLDVYPDFFANKFVGIA